MLSEKSSRIIADMPPRTGNGYGSSGRYLPNKFAIIFSSRLNALCDRLRVADWSLVAASIRATVVPTGASCLPSPTAISAVFARFRALSYVSFSSAKETCEGSLYGMVMIAF